MANIEENRTRRLIIRLKPKEFELIENRFKKSTLRKLSEYSRNVLLEKSITVLHRDKSMDEILEELILLRKELNCIGNNFNQSVRKLNSVRDMPDAHLWEGMLTVLRDELQPSIVQIKNRLNIYSELWSQRLSAEKASLVHSITMKRK